MTINKKDITFIIIAYNEEKTIKQCIECILNQDAEEKIKILVINDSSKDNTESVVKDLEKTNDSIKVISNEVNLGRGASRQRGVNESFTELIAFVDADIQIPTNWLKITKRSLCKFDAVGGIAIPDGDVQYVFTKFNLKPKVKKHTVEITGSNGLYKRKIFETINFSEAMRDGEDVDFVWRLKQNNIKIGTIHSLICLHREHKTYLKSISWLFQQGKGSSRLFKMFRKIRLPDMVFFSFLIICISSIVACFLFMNILFLAPIFLYILSVSLFHIRSKFYFSFSSDYIKSIIVNATLIAAYLVGRAVGTLY